MSDESTTEPLIYTSVFKHGVDEKRRVQIPSKWRPENVDWTYMLILWPNGGQPDTNILVLPPKQFASLLDNIGKMSPSDPKAQTLRRLIGSKSSGTKMDKAGRFMLNPDMAEKAGIEKEAVLVGAVDRFEIWSPKRYEAVAAADATLLTEAFGLLNK